MRVQQQIARAVELDAIFKLAWGMSSLLLECKAKALVTAAELAGKRF